MKASLIKGMAILLLGCLFLSVCACALGEAVISEEVRSSCVAAGGKLLDTPRTVRVVSPYGTQSVVLRDAPSDSYHAVAMLMVGQEMTAVGTHGEFYFVLIENDMTGWLAADEVKLMP